MDEAEQGIGFLAQIVSNYQFLVDEASIVAAFKRLLAIERIVFLGDRLQWRWGRFIHPSTIMNDAYWLYQRNTRMHVGLQEMLACKVSLEGNDA